MMRKKNMEKLMWEVGNKEDIAGMESGWQYKIKVG